MSTRASVQIIDGNDVIYFYQHSDGYPDGLGKWLSRCLQLPKLQECKDDSEYLAGVLMMEVNRDYIERNLRLPDMIPAVCVHGDEAYTYQINAKTLELTVLRGAVRPFLGENE